MRVPRGSADQQVEACEKVLGLARPTAMSVIAAGEPRTFDDLQLQVAVVGDVKGNQWRRVTFSFLVQP